jgi:hypothetical protein
MKTEFLLCRLAGRDSVFNLLEISYRHLLAIYADRSDPRLVVAYPGNTYVTASVALGQFLIFRVLERSHAP